MVEYNQKIMGMRLQNWRRITAYVVAVIVLFVGGYLIQFVDWQGGVFLHTLMELTATLLAFFVGTLALIRYMSQSDPKFLYIGAGFMGTAFLDAYHTVVTSSYFQPLMPTEYAQLVPWSWSASRLFLSVLMVMSWVLWLKHRNQNDFKPNTKVVFLFTAIATCACFMLFAFVPLPAISIGHDWIHRPFELIPAMLFLVALVGYLFKGMWVEDDFEHWLILSLIVGFGLQLAFMPFSAHVKDAEFNVAHLFKKLSYIFVLTGLLKSLYQTYISMKKESEKRLALEEALRQEAEASAQNEQWFRSVADYTYDWETWISPSGELLYTSPSCERITGYSASAFMTGEVGIASIISPSEAAATVRHFQDMPS
ncbi:MAG: MASE3 domain-containing protein, partial [Methylotenera sp.]|nr:MASE3 domain-containing protein [Methylotenera sp.]